MRRLAALTIIATLSLSACSTTSPDTQAMGKDAACVGVDATIANLSASSTAAKLAASVVYDQAKDKQVRRAAKAVKDSPADKQARKTLRRSLRSLCR